MASNYFTSAGTDLDSLFYIDNRNAGAIGFQVANGQDLGNRYSAESTLGYNVGYKNNAGTDLGYLRGTVTVPGIVSHSLGINRYYCYKSECSHTYTDNEGTHESSHRLKRAGGFITVYANVSASGILHREIMVSYVNKETLYGGEHTIELQLKPNSTENFAIGNVHPSVVVPSQTEGERRTLFTGTVSNSVPAFQFAYAYIGVLGIAHYTDEGYLRVYQRFYTTAGYTGWVSDDICITTYV